MLRILHVSDPHFEPKHHAFDLTPAAKRSLPAPAKKQIFPRGTMAAAIAKALKGIEVDAVVVTGDLTYMASDKEFDFAVRELSDLRDRLKVPPERMLVIPGNHDVDWSKRGAARFEAYAKAYERLCQRKCQSECDDEVIVRNASGELLRIVGVNSCRIESKAHAGMGAVGHHRLEQLLAADKTTPTILCLHHHLLPVAFESREYEKTRRSSVTLDAKAILDVCHHEGIRLVLHGHQHQPSLASYGAVNPVEPSGDARKLLWIAGAGSCGAIKNDLGDASQRHFQLIEYDSELGVCRMRSFASDVNNELAFSKRAEMPIALDIRVPVGETAHYRIEDKVLEQLRTADHVSGSEDLSDLFILLCKANDCSAANKLFQTLDTADARVEGVYDLYGDYDLLVKFRGTYKGIVDTLKPYISTPAEPRLLPRNYGKLLDITHEWYPSRRIDLSADETTHSIKAFVKFADVGSADNVIKVCSEIPQKFGRRTVVSGSFLADGGEDLIVEYYVACGAYYELSKVITELERRLGDENKVTLLAQTAMERRL